MSVEVSAEDWAQPQSALPRDFQWTVLRAVHDFGYVYKKGLAELLRVHTVAMGRIIDQLVEERFVRLAGYQVGCPYPAFRYKRFYTPTRAEVPKRLEIRRFYARADFRTMAGQMPKCCFLARRGSNQNGPAGANGRLGEREEWVPIHFAGAHVAMAFIASVINQSDGVREIDFQPERLLRRSKTALAPMPDGIISVNGTAYQYQVEFEAFAKKKVVYADLFDLYERAALPTVYVALTPQIAGVLDSVARDRKRIAIVMYGDEDGCASAIEGLNADLFWQPPNRYLKGPLEGYDLEKAEDDDVAPPGAR